MTLGRDFSKVIAKTFLSYNHVHIQTSSDLWNAFSLTISDSLITPLSNNLSACKRMKFLDCAYAVLYIFTQK